MSEFKIEKRGDMVFVIKTSPITLKNGLTLKPTQCIILHDDELEEFMKVIMEYGDQTRDKRLQ